MNQENEWRHVLSGIKHDRIRLNSVDEKYLSDRTIVLTAVKNSHRGGALRFASKELQADPEIIAAVR